jgi:hypothetical protein
VGLVALCIATVFLKNTVAASSGEDKLSGLDGAVRVVFDRLRPMVSPMQSIVAGEIE